MLNIFCTDQEKVKVGSQPKINPTTPAVITQPSTCVVVSGDGTFAQVDDTTFYFISGAAIADTVYAVTANGVFTDNVTLGVSAHVDVITDMGWILFPPEPK